MSGSSKHAAEIESEGVGVVRVVIGVVALLVLGVGAVAGWMTLADAGGAADAKVGANPSASGSAPDDSAGEPSSDGEPTVAGKVSTAAEPTGSGSASATAKEGCVAELAAAENVIEVARGGIDNWTQHVQASLDQAAGRISVETKREIWKRTRLAGPEDQRTYDEALAEYEEVTGRCFELSSEDNPDCVDRAQATTTILEATDGAMGDWERHLAQMAAFADGDFDEDRANEMWNVAKRIAPVNLDKFADADRALAAAPACA